MAVKDGLRISRLVESRTTKDQWEVLGVIALGLSIAFAILIRQFPDNPITQQAAENPDVAAGIILAIMGTMGPLLTRIFSFAKQPEFAVGVDPAAIAIKVKKYGQGWWNEHTGTLMDAKQEGWHYAVVVGGDGTGRIFDILKGEFTGESIRLPKPAVPDLEWDVEKIKSGM